MSFYLKKMQFNALCIGTRNVISYFNISYFKDFLVAVIELLEKNVENIKLLIVALQIALQIGRSNVIAAISIIL